MEEFKLLNYMLQQQQRTFVVVFFNIFFFKKKRDNLQWKKGSKIPENRHWFSFVGIMFCASFEKKIEPLPCRHWFAFVGISF